MDYQSEDYSFRFIKLCRVAFTVITVLFGTVIGLTVYIVEKL